jgi:hypothetical protein
VFPQQRQSEKDPLKKTDDFIKCHPPVCGEEMDCPVRTFQMVFQNAACGAEQKTAASEVVCVVST